MATTAAFTNVENKIPNVSELVKKKKLWCKKIKRLATTAELKAQQDKTVKLQGYDLIFFYWWI